MTDLIYVYCISEAPPKIVPQLESSGLECLTIGGFFINIKNVSESNFSEANLKKNLSDIQWLEIQVRDHISVINSIMEYSAVIPFKFGTIYNTKASLEKFIADYSDSLIENFQQISGMEEWAVKIYCDRKLLSKKIDELSVEAASLQKQISESSPGKAFLLNKKKIDLIENEMDRLCNQFGQEYYEEIKKLSESNSLNNLLPKEFTGREDSMIINASFLVKASNVIDFKNHINSMSDRVGESGFFIEVSGPWPPFSFISIKERSNE